MTQERRGYIAITSAFIVSTLLLVIVLAASASAFFYRFNAVDAEAKAASQALAEACMDRALLTITKNPLYAGNETLTIAPSNSCTIQAIGTSGAQKVITTSASTQNAATYLKVTVTLSPTTIVSWEEVAAP